MKAFPTVNYKKSEGVGVCIMEINGGMDLRDYFAAKTVTEIFNRMSSDVSGWDYEYVAKEAYAFADAMMKARGE